MGSNTNTTDLRIRVFSKSIYADFKNIIEKSSYAKLRELGFVKSSTGGNLLP